MGGANNQRNTSGQLQMLRVVRSADGAKAGKSRNLTPLHPKMQGLTTRDITQAIMPPLSILVSASLAIIRLGVPRHMEHCACCALTVVSPSTNFLVSPIFLFYALRSSRCCAGDGPESPSRICRLGRGVGINSVASKVSVGLHYEP